MDKATESENTKNVPPSTGHSVDVEMAKNTTNWLQSKEHHSLQLSTNTCLSLDLQNETHTNDIPVSGSIEKEERSADTQSSDLEKKRTFTSSESSDCLEDKRKLIETFQQLESTGNKYDSIHTYQSGDIISKHDSSDARQPGEQEFNTKSINVTKSLLPKDNETPTGMEQFMIDLGKTELSLNNRQIVCLAAVASTPICFSFLISWSAVLPKIEEDTALFAITKEDVSWLVSITSIVGVITALFSGSLMEWLGPRRLILSVILPMAGFWLMMAFSPYLSLLYVGRAGLAMCCCVTNICTQPLVAELCPTKIRGLISSSSEIVSATGILIGYILAQSLSWRAATGVAAIPLVPLFFIYLLAVPESPYWLVRHNKRREAERSLRLMMGPEFHVTEQLDAMTASSSNTGSFRDQVYLLRNREYAVPILLLWIIFLLREFGGKTALSSYSVYMFRQAKVEVDPYICTILLGLIRVIGHIMSALTMDRLGRKPFLIGSSLVCGLSVAVSGTFLWLELPGRSWVCLTLLLLFIISFGLGVGPIPWMFLGELIPTPVRPLGASFIILTYNSASFIVNYAFFKMLDNFGIGLTIAFFSIPNFLMLAITIIWLPETRGLSLEDLQISFRKKL